MPIFSSRNHLLVWVAESITLLFATWVQRKSRLKILPQTLLGGDWHARSCKYGNHNDIVGILLHKGANPNFKSKKYGFTPIFEAVYDGNIELAEILLSYGADINFKSKSDHTPLLIAVRENKTKMFKWLVEHGAKTDAVDGDGSTLLHWAVYVNKRSLLFVWLNSLYQRFNRTLNVFWQFWPDRNEFQKFCFKIKLI